MGCFAPPAHLNPIYPQGSRGSSLWGRVICLTSPGESATAQGPELISSGGLQKRVSSCPSWALALSFVAALNFLVWLCILMSRTCSRVQDPASYLAPDPRLVCFETEFVPPACFNARPQPWNKWTGPPPPPPKRWRPLLHQTIPVGAVILCVCVSVRLSNCLLSLLDGDWAHNCLHSGCCGDLGWDWGGNSLLLIWFIILGEARNYLFSAKQTHKRLS